MTKYLNTKQLAIYLGLSPRTLERYRVDGAGPAFIKIGKLVRYRTEDIDRWVHGLERTSTSNDARD